MACEATPLSAKLKAGDQPKAAPLRVCYAIESGTDVRTVEGLAERFELTVLARRIPGGVVISQEPARPVRLIVGPNSRAGFARMAMSYLTSHAREFDYLLVQGYGLIALVGNIVGRLKRLPTAMVVVSPVEAYYRCRRAVSDPDKAYRASELLALVVLARLNAVLGSRYLVPSYHLADVVRFGHGTRKPIDFVPIYGVDTKVFRPPDESKAAIRARLGLPTGGSLIFFSSRIAPEKDSPSLLGAMRRLQEKGRDIWLLHRSGGYRGLLEEARRAGVAARVIATDAVHPYRELPQSYQASDLCVQASREEGLGFSPLEAMACGVPVVASAVGGLRETVIDGVTGWTYPPGDAEALARCIEAALDDPAEATRRAAAGRELVRARFERDLVFDGFEAVIRRSVGADARQA